MAHVLAANPEWAVREAALRLDMHGEAAWMLTPNELALAFRCARERQNAERAFEAWRIAWLIAPHVARTHAQKATPRAILMGAPGFDPDPEDLL